MKALQLKKLESERPSTEDNSNESNTLTSGTGGNGEAVSVTVLPSHGQVEDGSTNQDSCSEGSPNGIIKVNYFSGKFLSQLVVYPKISRQSNLSLMTCVTSKQKTVLIQSY